MADVKITDLVEQGTIERIKELGREIKLLLDTYTNTARELAHGIEVPVRAIGDLERLEALLTTQSQEAIRTTQQLNVTLQQQGQVVANTTNTISRQLMEQERVNKTQREAYTEHERVNRLLEHFHDTYENQVRSLVGLNKELEQNKNAQSKLEKQLSMGQVSMSQYTARMADLITQQRALAQEKKTLQQLMTAEEKASQEVEDSYVAMSQKLELLKKAYKGLSEEGRGSDYGQELENTIQNLDAHLKDMAADMGEFQRNVGNYAIAAKGGIVTTESLNIALTQEAHTVKDLTDQNKILAEARSMLDMSSSDYAATLATVNAKIDENNKKIEESGQSSSSLKKDLKELVLEIANLSIEYAKLTEEEKNSAEGQELAEHIQELTERAGELKDAISDTNQAIANAASDTRGLDQLGGTLQLAIDGFGLAAGAASMLGISEDDLAKVQTKLMGAIAASNAMSKIQNALQKQSAVMQGVALVQTKLRTVAENIHTAAQGKGVIATKAATVAQWAFNAAANANPIGLIVVAIVACVAAVWGLVKAFEAFVGPSEEATKQCQDMIDETERLIETNDSLIESMERRGDSYAKVHAQIIQNLQEEYESMRRTYEYANSHNVDADTYERASAMYVEGYQKLQEAYIEGRDYFHKMINEAHDEELEAEVGVYEARRQLIQREYKEYEEYANRILQLGNQLGFNAAALLDWDAIKRKKQRALEQVNADEAKANEDANRAAADAAKKRQQDAERAAAELLKAVRAGEDALLSLIKDSLERQIEAENLAYNRKLEDLQAQLAKAKSTEVELRTAINKQIQGLTAAHLAKMAQLEIQSQERLISIQKEFLNLRIKNVQEGTQEELDLRLQLVEQSNQAEVLAIKKRVAAGELSEEDGARLITEITARLAKDKEDIIEAHNEKLIKMAQEQLAKEQAERDNQYVNDVAALKSKYAQEMEAARGNKAEQERLTQKFNADMAQLDEDYAVRSAQASVDAIEAALQMEGLTADEREKLAADLAKAKADLAAATADAEIAQMQRTVDADAKATEKRIANAQMWMQKAAEAMNAINDLASAIYDGKIQQLEEEQEANDEAAEADMERISTLVEQNVITEEEGEARKRAAEAATAKKNEELEKKKAALKHKQAVWDKANSIAQCGISTALAIMNALQMQPFPVGIAMAAIAGAMGAVQLATILATPIPKYAKGTDYHKGGPAVVGDGGKQEVVMYNGAAYLTPDTPTLVDIPAGASVLPDVANIDESLTKVVALSSVAHGDRPVIVNNDYTELKREMANVSTQIRAFMKQQRIIASNAEFNAYRAMI